MIPQNKPGAWIHPARRDGRYPVILVYPSTGRRLSKLLPRERALEIAGDASYTVFTAPRELLADSIKGVVQ